MAVRLRWPRLALLVVLASTLSISGAEAEAPEFQFAWGTHGSGDGQFSTPFSVALDAAGNVYVADGGNHRIQVFTADGRFLRTWGTFGSGNEQMHVPVAIDVAAGLVYVSDFELCRIQVFTTDGAYVRKWGSEGSNHGQFESATALDCDASGNVYVADTWNWRLQVFDPLGAYLWGYVGPISSTWGVATDGDGSVFFSQGGIHVFEHSGLLLDSWNLQGINSSYGMDVTSEGHLLVTEDGDHRVSEYTADGTWIRSFGSAGNGPGQFGDSGPRDVAVGPNGLIYVCDQSNDRIEVFGPATAVSPTTWGGIKALFRR